MKIHLIKNYINNYLKTIMKLNQANRIKYTKYIKK